MPQIETSAFVLQSTSQKDGFTIQFEGRTFVVEPDTDSDGMCFLIHNQNFPMLQTSVSTVEQVVDVLHAPDEWVTEDGEILYAAI